MPDPTDDDVRTLAASCGQNLLEYLETLQTVITDSMERSSGALSETSAEAALMKRLLDINLFESCLAITFNEITGLCEAVPGCISISNWVYDEAEMLEATGE